MLKLFVATVVLSTAFAGGLPPWRGASIGGLVGNSKIKSLTSIISLGGKDPYPGVDADSEAILKALAALSSPVTLEQVKNVLKEHAAKLYERVQAAEAAFIKVRDSVGNPQAKAVLSQFGELFEKNIFAIQPINEQAKEGLVFFKAVNALNDEAGKVFGEKLNEAAEAVEKALYKS